MNCFLTLIFRTMSPGGYQKASAFEAQVKAIYLVDFSKLVSLQRLCQQQFTQKGYL